MNDTQLQNEGLFGITVTFLPEQCVRGQCEGRKDNCEVIDGSDAYSLTAPDLTSVSRFDGSDAYSLTAPDLTSVSCFKKLEVSCQGFVDESTS